MCEEHSDRTTADTTEACCSRTAQNTTDPGDDSRWLDGRNLLEEPLPEEFRSVLGRFVGQESVDTLAEWASEIRRRTGGGAIDVDDLCRTDEETAHWGDVDGERYHFLCFYDAVILAALEEQAVDVHTVSPGGTVVQSTIEGAEKLSVTPETAVFSLGIALDAHERSGGDPTLQDSYAAVCPYVKAFPDRDAYEAWADDVPAVTVATPLSGATAFARVLTGE